MKPLAIIFTALVFAGCARQHAIPMGDGTYFIHADANMFTFDAGRAIENARQEASEICAKQGAKAVILSVEGENSGMAKFAQAEMRFRCVTSP
jgi:hypothetical protein